ncbi:MAG TPA: deaminase [Patescibacteria group bacterium]|nr:deaminase [Patescibacteria group bacterium]
MSLPSLAEIATAPYASGAEILLTDDEITTAALAALTIELPQIAERATLYLPDRQVLPVEAELTEAEEEAMALCLAMGRSALTRGNPPVGAVLLDNERGLSWGAMTIDKTTPHILGHGEVRAYGQAHEVVGDQLQNCTLVTTAQPCNTCTCPYAEGQIGRIVFAAPRSAIYAVSGLMRPREINMPDLLRDGNTTTVVMQGHRARDALASFATWGELHRTGKLRK